MAVDAPVERLDWFDGPEQRRRTGSILNKGDARNALARSIRSEHSGTATCVGATSRIV